MESTTFDDWIKVCQIVSGTFVDDPRKYKDWQFIVGSSGWDEDRIIRGAHAFKKMRPTHYDITKPIEYDDEAIDTIAARAEHNYWKRRNRGEKCEIKP